ncbi:MAG: DEAD/DEAH box helicase [Treponema sp.]|jgi:superfamily II DNA/RNA helicase|nr:DEAD/DEAH box helicase [Treponema sp.]
MDAFADLGVSPRFIEKLKERNILTPTEIQKRVIPLLADGQNLIFRSATGTGKTFAYLLPLLQRLRTGEAAAASGSGESGGSGQNGRGKGGGPLMLICAPTYELCSQIKAEADFLLRPGNNEGGSVPGSAVSLIIGSAAISRQIETLKKERPLVVAGNPGRLLVLARMGKLKLKGLKILVLDEGDRLTADELLEETTELVKLLPRSGCLMAACSATLSQKSRERMFSLMGNDPLVVETEDREILRDRIEHWAIFSEERRKLSTLRSLLAAVKPKKALVFSGRGGQPGNIVSQLQHHHISALGLYGDMDKKKRKEAIDSFRSGKIPVLVSSDLAARGLDISGVTHVIALDVPAGEDPYIHRAGRTGRAGKRGVMVTIGDADEMRRLVRLEKKLGIVVHPKELHGGRAWDCGLVSSG